MIRLEGHKSLTKDKAIERAPVPSKVFIPLLQHAGKPLDLLKVKVNDTVKRGQCLATAREGVFSPVHASISGIVKAITDCPHPAAGRCPCVVIEGDGRDEACDGMAPRDPRDVDLLRPEDLRRIIFESGVVGLGGAAFPTHIKLAPVHGARNFILNGAECEPYLTTDDRLMVERADEIVKGVKLLMKILGAVRCAIAVEDDKSEAIRLMRERAAMFYWDVVVLKTAYPQGSERQVVKSCLGREVPPGKFPLDIGVAVHNVATVYAVYEAVYLGKPLYERAMTVSGTCLAHPKNLLVRLGTPVKDLIAPCGPLLKKPRKIVMGGPMTGTALFSEESPVIKPTSGVLFFDEAEAREQEESYCIRCGECVSHCPMGLTPGKIASAVTGEDMKSAEALGVMECTECGLCSYVCAGHRDIVRLIKAAKARIRHENS